MTYGGRRAADPFLRRTAIAFAAGFGVHALDHLRRGLSASPTRVMIIGTIQGILVAAAVFAALRGKRGAPIAAILVGFGSALLFTYGHLLPATSPGYSDSFVSPPHTNVTWFSWVTAVAEIGTGVLFGAAGIRVLSRRVGEDHVVPTASR